MASAAAANALRPSICSHRPKNDTSKICRRALAGKRKSLRRLNHLHFPSTNDMLFRVFPSLTTSSSSALTITCSASEEPSSSNDQIRSTAKIRSEVLSPYRSVRMFFYAAFIGSGGLGGLIAATKLAAALSNPGRPGQTVTEIAQGLAIDLAAVALFAVLYWRDSKAGDAQVARLSREETLSGLRLRAGDRTVDVGSLRGAARLVVCAGDTEFLREAFRRSRGFSDGLTERGVLVVPFATDGVLPSFDGETDVDGDEKLLKRLWKLRPVNVSEWSKWLDEQKKLAGVSPESPVYLSLRMDGRVRGSGVGYPPWNAFVAQLPPVKGLWSGLFDGMDGRV